MRCIALVLLACLIPLQVRADTPGELRLKLRHVEQRLAEVDAQRSAAGPIALTAIGGMSAGAALMVPLLLWLAPTFAGAGRPGSATKADGEVYLWSAGLSLLGIGMAVGGGVWLARRLRARRLLAPERRELLEQREQLSGEVGLYAAAGGASLTLRTRF